VEKDGAVRRRKRPRKRGRKRKWKLTKQEVALTHLDQALPGMGAAFVLQAYRKAELEGDFSDVEKIAAQAMAENEVIRRQAVNDVLERGVLFDEPLINGKGEAIGTRLRAHPLLDRLQRLDEQLGHTADQQQITPKSGGGKKVNAALAFRLSRDAALRALDPDRRRLPPPETPGD
jgi:hypothetical protein